MGREGGGGGEERGARERGEEVGSDSVQPRGEIFLYIFLFLFLLFILNKYLAIYS
jgi:hypothetical protein